MHILFFKMVLIILSLSTKHCNFWLGVQFPLNDNQPANVFLESMSRHQPSGANFTFIHSNLLNQRPFLELLIRGSARVNRKRGRRNLRGQGVGPPVGVQGVDSHSEESDTF